jgi:Glycosidases
MDIKLSGKSKIKEIYKNPIGHDILHKLLLQMNKKETLITNPIVRNLRLESITGLINKRMGDGFTDTLLGLLNSEPDKPVDHAVKIRKTWWKQAVFYQIYPRSFQDSDGDGIGDLKGIISKLDYLKDLGIDAIWLSPIYDSPNDDNGYDIRDYRSIMEEFGTMEDFELLLGEVHFRGMKLIMDLVVNHTSDEHPWFQKAIDYPSSDYHDFYLFRKSSDRKPPNNWTSYFSGSAWNYYKKNGEWGLHLFSKKQMDLNWNNEKLREEIKDMIRWWLSKGVDGFRLDVINYISKTDGLPDGNENIGKLLGYYGVEHYFYGPRLHQYLKELKQEVFGPFGAFTVGETPGVGMEMSKLLTAENRKELDMVFSFDHLETSGHLRFEDYRYDLNYLKKYLCDWMENYGNSCWMSLFYENHDNPRMISKVNPDPAYREVLAKLLAMIQLTLKGTPFIFQGQEIGRINKRFRSIDDMRDVESINLYQELLPSVGKDEALQKVLSGSRDHARTPMQWSDGINAGFSEAIPWIDPDKEDKKCNVEAQLANPNSVLHFYKALISVRKKHPTLIYGKFIPVNKERRDIFTYYRKTREEAYYVECNLSCRTLKRKHSVKTYQQVLSNYQKISTELRPYEANLYKIKLF